MTQKMNRSYGWPRLMKARTGAAYIECSETEFYRLVERGRISQPVVDDGKVRWMRDDLDEYIDNLKRRGAPANDDWTDKEAAL